MECKYRSCVKGEIAGYMTVEATLILSMVFWVYLFLIRSFFGMYDRCVLELDIASLALRCANAKEQELETIWQREVVSLDLERYLWLELQEPVLQKQGWRCTVTGRGSDGGLGDCVVSYKMWCFAPEDWLRRSRHLSREEKGEPEE